MSQGLAQNAIGITQRKPIADHIGFLLAVVVILFWIGGGLTSLFRSFISYPSEYANAAAFFSALYLVHVIVRDAVRHAITATSQSSSQSLADTVGDAVRRELLYRDREIAEVLADVRVRGISLDRDPQHQLETALLEIASRKSN